MLGSNHPKPLQDINVNTSHHVCTNILTATTSSGDTKQSRLESTTEITQNKHVTKSIALLCR